MSHEEKTSEVQRFKLNMNNFVLSSVGDEAVLVPVSNSTANMGGVMNLMAQRPTFSLLCKPMMPKVKVSQPSSWSTPSLQSMKLTT